MNQALKLTIDESTLHVAGGGVDVVLVLVVQTVLEQQFSVWQALHDGVHEARVAHIAQAHQTAWCHGRCGWNFLRITANLRKQPVLVMLSTSC